MENEINYKNFIINFLKNKNYFVVKYNLTEDVAKSYVDLIIENKSNDTMQQIKNEQLILTKFFIDPNIFIKY